MGEKFLGAECEGMVWFSAFGVAGSVVGRGHGRCVRRQEVTCKPQEGSCGGERPRRSPVRREGTVFCTANMLLHLDVEA